MEPPGGLKLLVTPMKDSHLDQVTELEGICFPQPWPRRVFQALAHHPGSLALVCQSLSGFVVGTCCLMLDQTRLQVQNLSVHPACRRRGVARHLLLAGLARGLRRGAREARLEVRPSNLAARRLYESLGFSELGRKPGYYALPAEDALVLGCELEKLFEGLPDKKLFTDPADMG
jgi:ribosomal-protein-alanine N-acetyltransferase